MIMSDTTRPCDFPEINTEIKPCLIFYHWKLYSIIITLGTVNPVLNGHHGDKENVGFLRQVTS